MKFDKSFLKLYAITGREWMNGRDLADEVKKAVQSGVTCLQIREKDVDDECYLKRAVELKKICNEYSIPLIVNDNVKIALESGSDGVHIGQTDLAGYQNVRSCIGPDKILGISANSVDLAVKAEEYGADYIGVGSIKTSPTKEESKVLTLDCIKEICESVSIPVVAIGGIDEYNIPLLKNSGVSGVAVISSIFSKKDVAKATKNLRALVDEYL